MTKEEFVAKEQRAATTFMEAIEAMQGLIAVYDDIGTELTLDQTQTDCGVAFKAVFTALGSGSASNRAKINRMRL